MPYLYPCTHFCQGKPPDYLLPAMGAVRGGGISMVTSWDIFAWVGYQIVTVLLWFLLALGSMALVRYLFARARNKKAATTILEERYAKGEIEKKEFEEKRKDLQEGVPSPSLRKWLFS